MHDARWINLKPLSLLPRLIQERMTGMIASPPVNMFLPPRPRERPIPNQAVGAIEIARASGDTLIKQLSKMRASSQGPEFDESVLAPQPGDEEIARYLTFDFSRMGSVARGGGAGMMPTGQFKFDLNWLTFHLSSAANEVLACKEAIWEYWREQDPEADRREFDAMVRQYQTYVPRYYLDLANTSQGHARPHRHELQTPGQTPMGPTRIRLYENPRTASVRGTIRPGYCAGRAAGRRTTTTARNEVLPVVCGFQSREQCTVRFMLSFMTM